VIITPRIVLRIALLMVGIVVLQIAFLSEITILGAPPDLVPVLIVSLGLLGGGVAGAVCGFAAGLLFDAALLHTMGVSSLVLLTTGYLAGRYREGFEISSALVPALLAGGLTMFAASAFAAIQLMLGVEAPVSLLVVREVVVQGLLSFVFAIPLYAAVRRILRPALVEDLPRRTPFPTPFRTA
jgi:rod shape-determining protein MreD